MLLEKPLWRASYRSDSIKLRSYGTLLDLLTLTRSCEAGGAPAPRSWVRDLAVLKCLVPSGGSTNILLWCLAPLPRSSRFDLLRSSGETFSLSSARYWIMLR